MVEHQYLFFIVYYKMYNYIEHTLTDVHRKLWCVNQAYMMILHLQ